MQNIITSKSNEKVNFLSRLSQKKYRDRFGKFLIENLVTIHDAFIDGLKPESIYISKELLKSNDARVNFIVKGMPNYFVIDETINKVFSSLDTPSGICAVYKKTSSKIDMKKSVLYLNGISDPGNLGAILRNAVAFGIKNVVVDSRCVDIYNPKTLNAGKDAVFKLNIEEDKSLILMKSIKEKMPIISTNVKQGQNLKEIEATKLFCLVLGSESHGVSSEIEKLSDKLVTIKMTTEMESLNVAVASGILLYELVN